MDRPIIFQEPVIGSGSNGKTSNPPVSGNMASTITSNASILLRISMASYTFNWSGSSPVGTIQIQVSDDYALSPNGSVANAGNWISIPLQYNGASTTTIPVSGNTGNGQIDLPGMCAYAVRAIYTPTSGTGTLNAIFEGKVM